MIRPRRHLKGGTLSLTITKVPGVNGLDFRSIVAIDANIQGSSVSENAATSVEDAHILTDDFVEHLPDLVEVWQIKSLQSGNVPELEE